MRAVCRDIRRHVSSTSHRTIKAGGTIPASHVREPVNIEELFNMFDERTRTANQVQLNNYGDGLAGRGLGLNNTIATLRPLLTNAIPVFRNLASPATNLHELWVALERAPRFRRYSRAVLGGAPVSAPRVCRSSHASIHSGFRRMARRPCTRT